ncbi:MAG: hypothetical protein RR906_04585, partial [Acetivibrio sp.]
QKNIPFIPKTYRINQSIDGKNRKYYTLLYTGKETKFIIAASNKRSPYGVEKGVDICGKML